MRGFFGYLPKLHLDGMSFGNLSFRVSNIIPNLRKVGDARFRLMACAAMLNVVDAMQRYCFSADGGDYVFNFEEDHLLFGLDKKLKNGTCGIENFESQEKCNLGRVSLTEIGKYDAKLRPHGMGTVASVFTAHLFSVRGTTPTEKFLKCFNDTVDVIYQRNYIPPKPHTASDLVFGVVLAFAVAGVTLGCIYLNEERPNNRDVELGVVNDGPHINPPANPVAVPVDDKEDGAVRAPLLMSDDAEGQSTFAKRHKELMERAERLKKPSTTNTTDSDSKKDVKKDDAKTEVALSGLLERLRKFETDHTCAIKKGIYNEPISFPSGQTYEKTELLRSIAMGRYKCPKNNQLALCDEKLIRAQFNPATYSAADQPAQLEILKRLDRALKFQINVDLRTAMEKELTQLEGELHALENPGVSASAAAVDNIASALAANNAAAGDAGVVEGAVAVTIQPARPPSPSNRL